MIAEIDVRQEEGVMSILWRDRTRQDISLEALRRGCPCAVCEGNRAAESEDALHMIEPEALNASARITEVVPVGRYAIQIRWEDGHDTGIYTYAYLKSFGSVRASRDADTERKGNP